MLQLPNLVRHPAHPHRQHHSQPARRCPTDLFDDLFPHCLEILADHGALEPFLRLDGRLLIAVDGIEIQKSYKIHCPHCSTRHVGTNKTPQYFHSMIGPAIVADDHNRVIPLMPEFIEPQQDPAAEDTELTGERQKQDCERNAAKLPRQNSVAEGHYCGLESCSWPV